MKFVDIAEVTNHIIEADDGAVYERFDAESWCELMGCSWECILDREDLAELEQAFQDKARDMALDSIEDAKRR